MINTRSSGPLANIVREDVAPRHMSKAKRASKNQSGIWALVEIIKEAPLWRKFLVLSLMLVPYDAMRVMPSNYRPLSVVPLMILLIVLVQDGGARRCVRFGRAHAALLLFAAIYLITSMVRIFTGEIQVAEMLSEGIVLCIGIVAFVSLAWSFRLRVRQTGIRQTAAETIKILGYAYVIPLIVGLLEALSLYGVLPIEVNQALIAVFGGNQTNRLCLTSFEASWASVHLLIAFAVYLYLSRNNVRWMACCIVALLLFVVAQSAQGVIVLCLSVLCAAAYAAITRRRIKVFILSVAAVAAVVCGVWVYAKVSYANGNTAYYISRIANFASVDKLISNDASVFVRLLFPLFGLLLFFKSPLIGYGAGGFERLIPGHLRENYAWARRLEEIRRYMDGELTPSATCLYTKVLTETGILGGIPFFYFLASELRNAFGLIRQLENDVPVVLLYSIVLFNMLQFASYAYVPLWLLLSLAEASTEDPNTEKAA